MPIVPAYTTNRTSHSAALRRFIRSGAEGPGYDELLHLIRPLSDRQDLRVAVEAAHGILLDVSVAAVDLHGLVGRLHGEAAALQLRLRRDQPEVPPLVLQPRRLVGEEPRRL